MRSYFIDTYVSWYFWWSLGELFGEAAVSITSLVVHHPHCSRGLVDLQAPATQFATAAAAAGMFKSTIFAHGPRPTSWHHDAISGLTKGPGLSTSRHGLNSELRFLPERSGTTYYQSQLSFHHAFFTVAEEGTGVAMYQYLPHYKIVCFQLD